MYFAVKSIKSDNLSQNYSNMLNYRIFWPRLSSVTSRGVVGWKYSRWRLAVGCRVVLQSFCPVGAYVRVWRGFRGSKDSSTVGKRKPYAKVMGMSLPPGAWWLPSFRRTWTISRAERVQFRVGACRLLLACITRELIYVTDNSCRRVACVACEC